MDFILDKRMGTTILSLCGGIVLGLLYFAGLWLTVRRMHAAKHPWRFFAVSYVLRLALAVSCFYFLILSGWQHAVAALIGFVAVRYILGRRLGCPASPGEADKETFTDGYHT